MLYYKDFLCCLNIATSISHPLILHSTACASSHLLGVVFRLLAFKVMNDMLALKYTNLLFIFLLKQPKLPLKLLCMTISRDAPDCDLGRCQLIQGINVRGHQIHKKSKYRDLTSLHSQRWSFGWTWLHVASQHLGKEDEEDRAEG